MPEEIVPIVIVLSFLMFVFTVIKTTQQYKLKKLDHESGRSSSDTSLTTSELEELIRDAVDEATAPMKAKLEAVKARLDEIEEGGSSSILDGMENVVDEPDLGAKTVGRQASRS